MKSIIITQTEEIINFDNLLKITIAEASIDDKDLYALIAYPIGVKPTEDDSDQLIQLGLYDDENKILKVYDDLIKFLGNGVASVFRIPIDVGEG